jgi:tetratricopeptide (TPR) repeat protein
VREHREGARGLRALSRFIALGLIAALLAGGANAQPVERPKATCNGALVGIPTDIIEACTAYIAENPQRTSSLARAYTWRGRAYEHLGDPDRAIEDLGQAIDIEPSPVAFTVRADAHRRKGEDERALSDYESALSIKREAFPLMGMIAIYREREQYDLALLAFDEVMELWSRRDASLYHIRGHIYRDAGQLEKSLQDFDKALELVPWIEAARSDRCVALSLLGKAEEGLRDCNEAIEKDPGTATNFLNRGAVYLRLNRPDEAAADFERAFDVDPDDPEALYARGVGRRLEGDTAGGDADIASARALAPKVGRRLEKIGIK